MMNISLNKTLKSLTTLLCGILISGFSIGQETPANNSYNDSIISRLQVYESFDLPSDFKSQYRNALRRVRKVYPLALEAARVIDSLENELATIDKSRKQRKLMRNTKKELVSDFKYLLKDLYISEGKVLTKLIYRETGMTATEIISKYKNGFEASLYSGMAGFFEQDLDAKYYPNTEDFVLECVINDIKSGKVDFDPTFEILSKAEYKKEKKEYKESKKQNKKKIKQLEEIARQKQLESKNN
ncbi:DUF4294 domain-containing protein [Brumimicrobium mesophilum]|uniref:DUF4294 domain-containing protein n=1 Tax=Brumimicrobium mesophilum TaxID=392717 RepID=UPI000D140269|nr:DUF4294 domain-containing protein [Brumimicrobium mesophilum]